MVYYYLVFALAEAEGILDPLQRQRLEGNITATRKALRDQSAILAFSEIWELNETWARRFIRFSRFFNRADPGDAAAAVKMKRAFEMARDQAYDWRTGGSGHSRMLMQNWRGCCTTREYRCVQSQMMRHSSRTVSKLSIPQAGLGNMIYLRVVRWTRMLSDMIRCYNT